MKMKSYFADSVEAAVERARAELGPEALLVYSREAPPEARRLGSYEVVFAEAPSEGRAAAAVGERGGAASSGSSTADGRKAVAGVELAAELRELRRQVGRIAAALARAGKLSPPEGAFERAVEIVAEELSGVGLQAGPFSELMVALWRCAETTAIAGEEDLARALCGCLREELEKRLSVDAGLGRAEGGGPFVLLAGPAGSGKTTTLVKLAASHVLKQRRPVQILSLDTVRVGAAGQLQSYAGILGVACQVLESPSELPRTLQGQESHDLVLIDTPGYSARDAGALVELGEILADCPPVEVHLVLSAAMKTADLRWAVERFRPLRPAGLIFTHLDETRSPGSVVAEAIQTAMPVSFLAAGERIPEDLEPASPGRVVELLVGGVERRLAAELAGAPSEGLLPGRAGRAAAA